MCRGALWSLFERFQEFSISTGVVSLEPTTGMTLLMDGFSEIQLGISISFFGLLVPIPWPHMRNDAMYLKGLSNKVPTRRDTHFELAMER